MCFCLSKHDLMQFIRLIEIKKLEQNSNEMLSSVYKTEKIVPGVYEGMGNGPSHTSLLEL